MKEYNKLTIMDRYVIKLGIDNRESLPKIAQKLGRHRSVITREINKNGGKLWYDPVKAQKESKPSYKTGYSKIDKTDVLKAYVIEKIKIGWSPVVVAGRWNMENRDVKISPESIYEWIYSDKTKHEKLYIYLPRRKKKRGMVVRKSLIKDQNKKLIDARPEEVNQRSRFGDWEADLVFQRGDQSANFLTAIERTTRFTCVIKHETKSSEAIGRSIKKIEQKYDIKTLTLDNGSEFAKHAEYASDTYFCNPGSPWQKGAIEHFNGMLRRRIDYRIPMGNISQDFIDQIVEALNNMPRKILGFLTPKEAIDMSRVKLARPATEAISMCH